MEIMQLDKYHDRHGEFVFNISNKTYKLTLRERLYQATNETNLIEVYLTYEGIATKIYIKYAIIEYIVLKLQNNILDVKAQYYEQLAINSLVSALNIQHKLNLSLIRYNVLEKLDTQDFYMFIEVCSTESALNSYMLIDYNKNINLIQIFEKYNMTRICNQIDKFNLPIYLDAGYLTHAEIDNLHVGDLLRLDLALSQTSNLYVDFGTKVILER